MRSTHTHTYTRKHTHPSTSLPTAGPHGTNLLLHIIKSKGKPGTSLEWYAEYMRDLLCIITMQLLVSGPNSPKAQACCLS